MVCKTHLKRTQAGPGRAVQEQQELISLNHIPAILGCSVYRYEQIDLYVEKVWNGEAKIN